MTSSTSTTGTNTTGNNGVISIPTDPKLIGPGIWFIIHLTARKAVDEPTKRAFLELMKSLAQKFPCEKCRTHINEYLAKNPIEHYWNGKNPSGEENGLFTWSWNFHNTVNTRLGKVYVDYDTAWNMYGDGITICTSNCGDSAGHNDHVPVSTSQSTSQSTAKVPSPQIFLQGLHQQGPILPELTIYPHQGPQNGTLPAPLLRALGPTLFS